MSDRLRHVLSALSAPWAITPEAFETVCEIVDRRASGVKYSHEEIAQIVRESNAEFAERHAAAGAFGGSSGGSVAVIAIYGTILPRPVSALSGGGGTALSSFMDAFKAADADPSVGAILLDVDSPGGSAYLVPEAAEMIRNASKTVTAIANTTCASAAYWLASQADEFVASPSAMVGSIGVFARHVDYSAQLAAEGVKVTYISAGANKVEGNPTEPLSDNARAQLQEMVDECYDDFVNSVASGRGVSPDEVTGSFGQGRMFSAVAAAGLGMVDRVATFDEVVAQMLGTSTSGYGQRHALALNDATIDALAGRDIPEAIPGVQRISLRPDDRLLVRVKDNICMEQAQKIKEMVETEFPGHKAIVVSGDVDMTVLAEDSPAPTAERHDGADTPVKAHDVDRYAEMHRYTDSGIGSTGR